MGDRRGTYRVFVGETWRKETTWKTDAWMDSQEVGKGRGRDWFDLARDRDRWRVLVNAVMNLRAP
jgi:hypothetical protein